jgi:uncharacterized membrane protein YkoI
MLETSQRRWFAAAGMLAVALVLGATGVAAVQARDTRDRTDPTYRSSVTVRGGPTADEHDPNLQRVATITPDQAKQAAQGVAPGTPSAPELENENGNVVFEMKVAGTDGSETKVQVDAGNGTVLAQERERDEHEDAVEDESNEAPEHEAEAPEVETDGD